MDARSLSSGDYTLILTFYKARLRLCTSLWERRSQTIFSPFQCNYRALEAQGVWLKALQLCSDPMRISAAKGPKWPALSLVQKDVEETVVGIPQRSLRSLVCLFLLSAQRVPLALWIPRPWRAFCFPSATLTHIAVSLKSALQVMPASRESMCTWI